MKAIKCYSKGSSRVRVAMGLWVRLAVAPTTADCAGHHVEVQVSATLENHP